MTAGAASDIKIATKYARAMVVELGMSDLGPINFGSNAEYGDFGALKMFEEAEISEITKKAIDDEVNKIIKTAYAEAAKIITKQRRLLDKLSAELLEHETLTKDEFEAIMGKKQES